MHVRIPALAAASLALVATACIFVDADTTSDSSDSVHHHATARAAIEGKSGSSLNGWATFEEVEGGTLVEVHVEDAPPGWHAVHVHEKGDCSAADGTSAGGHFNPAGTQHGAPDALMHHAGDLGNMVVGENGVGHKIILMPDLTVRDGPASVRGRAIIVHAGVDDLTSQPTGNAGGRIGCGVIH